MSALDVVCVGSATADTIAAVPFIPGDDERVLASEILSAGGGPAATAAVAMARLGLAVGFCGVVGDDDAGRAVRADLIREGVRVDWLQTDPRVRTAQSVVLASAASAGRTIVTVRAPAPTWESVPVGRSTWLHADQTGFEAVLDAVRRRPHLPRPRVAVDGGNQLPARPLAGVDLYAPAVPALLARYPNAATAAEAMRESAHEGAVLVVATDGPRGCLVLKPGGDVGTVEPFADVVVTSTLGAGDVFHGALLAALVNQVPLTQAVGLANVVAALSCRALDGRSAIPDRKELCGVLSSVHPTVGSGWPFPSGVEQ